MAYSKKRKYSAKAKTYKRKVARKVSPKVKTYVQREIARLAENKAQKLDILNAVVDSTIAEGDVRNLIPSLAQGATQSSRVGNQIRVKSLKMRMHIQAYSQELTNTAIYFDIYIFKFRGANFGTIAPDLADMVLFLEDGASATQYNGSTNPISGLRPLNNSLFKSCIRRRITLFNPINGTSQVGITTGAPTARTFTFDLTPHVKKLLRYDDSAQSVQNDNLYLAVGGTYLDTAAITTNLGKYTCQIDLRYEDM